jgi:dTDP-3-amino-3,4,6-trideoxy-alpha-D-glucose transaminase
MIPQASPPLRIARYRQEIDQAIARVVGGKNYILGPHVEAFEQAFAATIGTPHCVGVASGTDALVLALRALGIGPGDEVITVAMTMAGTAQAIVATGATPCFVDIDPVNWVMDAAQAEAAVGPRTRAILPVHLYGGAAPVVQLRRVADRHGLALVEDCAQAHGAWIAEGQLGSFGHAAAFSFYPTKNLGGIGDGGAVTTKDAALAARLRSLRAYGWGEGDRISHLPATNSRLDELQASILLALLGHLEEGNAERREIAGYYAARFAGTEMAVSPLAPGAVHHQFAIGIDRRDDRIARLAALGVGTAVHYTPPLHHQPAFARFAPGPLPVTELLAARLISLPIQPEVAGRHRVAVADAVLKVMQDG